VRPPDETIREHLAIIDAVCTGQATLAENLMRTRLANSTRVLRRMIVGATTKAPTSPAI